MDDRIRARDILDAQEGTGPVALLDLDEGVVVVGHARQSRHRLALASGAEDHCLVGSQLGQQVRLDEDVLRHVQVSEVARDVDVLTEGAPDQANLALVLERYVDRLLHPVHVGGEGGDQNASLALGDDLTEDLAHGLLGQRHPRALGVRRITEKKVHAAVAEVGELAEVGAETVHRRVVDLVVAGVQHPEVPARSRTARRSSRGRARRASTGSARASDASPRSGERAPRVGETGARPCGPRARA